MLYLTALLCGFCLMALELLGARYLQPAFGSSIDLWAGIITVFILAMSVGSAIGGWMADKLRKNSILGLLILAAGLWYLILPVIARPSIEFLGPAVHAARWGALLASMLLFFAPALLLGSITPLLVLLALPDSRYVGRTTGAFYALGAFGNVLGVLVCDYVMLVHWTLNANVLAMGLGLGVLGLAHLVFHIRNLSDHSA